MADWNVFFSTVSQTCGAVVGIFSAFLITKIIADQADFSKLKDKVSDMIGKSDYLKANFEKAGFEGVNNSELKDLSDNLYEAIKKEKLEKDPSHYLQFVEQPIYASKASVVEHIQTAINRAKKYQREQELKKLEEERKAEADRLIEKALGKSHINNMRLWERLQKPSIDHSDIPSFIAERNYLASASINRKNDDDKREQLIVDANHQVSLNKKLLSETQGSDVAQKLVSHSLSIVLLLFYIGVIYPLSFLPLQPNTEITLSISAFFDILFSLKGVLLALLTISFSFLIITFWRVNKRLKLTKAEIDELIEFSKPEGISTFLKNYCDNKC